MRPSNLALGLLAVLIATCLLIFGFFFQSTVAEREKLLANRALVEKLGLTDLAGC